MTPFKVCHPCSLYLSDLKDHTKTKGVKLWTFIICKQFIEVVVEEQISAVNPQLKSCTIAEIIQIEIIPVFFLLKIAIFFKN